MRKIFSLLLPILLLSACGDDQLEKQNATKKQSMLDARNASSEIQDSYLKCYPLGFNQKRSCVKKLNEKYLSAELSSNSHYASAFQYEAEKQGFIRVLRKVNIQCNYLDQSPKFLDEAKAYLIMCDNKDIHFLRFDYATGEWAVVK